MMLHKQIRNPSSSKVKLESETTTEVAAQKKVEEHNEVQKVVEAREYLRSTRSTSRKDNDSHCVSGMKKIETYTTASKKSEDAEKHEIGDSNTRDEYKHTSMMDEVSTETDATSADDRRRTNRTHRVGALLPMPSCLGIGGHTGGSRQGHPRYTSASTEGGRGWPDRRLTRHHNDTTKGDQRCSGASSSNTHAVLLFGVNSEITPHHRHGKTYPVAKTSLDGM